MMWKWFIGIHEISTKIELGTIHIGCQVRKPFSGRFICGWISHIGYLRHTGVRWKVIQMLLFVTIGA